MRETAAPSVVVGGAEQSGRREGSLFHPAVDFLLAGGASLLFLVPAAVVVGRNESLLEHAAALALFLATVVNYPHFAHSYQILYTGIRAKIFGRDTPRTIRLRYLWAGVVAPALIALFLGSACAAGNPEALGYGVNAMLFLVGWHYVKQGYGVLVVLSAIRGIRYGDVERKWLLRNAYAVWIYS
ncbi:MAG: hypothetical protein ACREQY_02350, partial [Candidatus Binatia bacterium]